MYYQLFIFLIWKLVPCFNTDYNNIITICKHTEIGHTDLLLNNKRYCSLKILLINIANVWTSVYNTNDLVLFHTLYNILDTKIIFFLATYTQVVETWTEIWQICPHYFSHNINSYTSAKHACLMKTDLCCQQWLP